MYRRTILATLAFAPLLLFSGQTLADTANSDTGANSNNQASAAISNILQINNSNSMSVDNHLTLGQTTGNNGAGMNTGSGSIDSGSTNASITITNSGNTISINGSTDTDTNGNNGDTTTTTISGDPKGTVTVTNDGNTQKVKATLGPNGELNVDSSSNQNNSSKAMVLSAATGNPGNNGTARDPFTVTQGDSLSMFFVKYILPLLLIGLVLAAVVWGYVRKNTNPQGIGR